MSAETRIAEFLTEVNVALSAGGSLTHGQDRGVFLLRNKIRIPDELRQSVLTRLIGAYGIEQSPGRSFDVYSKVDLFAVLDSRGVNLQNAGEEFDLLDKDELMKPYLKGERESFGMQYKLSWLAFLQLNILAAAFSIAQEKFAKINVEADKINNDPFSYGRSESFNMAEEGYAALNRVAYAVSRTDESYGLRLISEQDVLRSPYLEIHRTGDEVAKEIVGNFNAFRTAQEIGVKFKDHSSGQLEAVVNGNFDRSLYLRA